MQVKKDDEIIVVTKDNIVCDVLVNGKPVKLYTVVPKAQLSKYLHDRGWNKRVKL